MAITPGDWPLVPGAKAFARIPSATLSATTASTSLKAGAEIATIDTGLAGAVVDGISSTDRKVVLSPDKTKLLRGTAAISQGDLDVSVYVSHPKALQSPVETKFKLSFVTPAIGSVAVVALNPTTADPMNPKVGDTFRIVPLDISAPYDSIAYSWYASASGSLSGASLGKFTELLTVNFAMAGKKLWGSARLSKNGVLSPVVYSPVSTAQISSNLILIDNLDDGDETVKKLEGTAAGSVKGSGSTVVTDAKLLRVIADKSLAMADMDIVAWWTRKDQNLLSFKHAVELGVGASAPVGTALRWPGAENSFYKNDHNISALPPGWYPAAVNVKDFPTLPTGAGNPRITHRAYHRSGGSFSARHVVDRMTGKARTKGKLIPTFDDTLKDQIIYLEPLFREGGFRFHMNIAPDWIAAGGNRATLAQLVGAYDRGAVDYGPDSRKDGSPFAKLLLDKPTALPAEILTNEKGIYATQDALRDLFGGGQYTRGYMHGCWAGTNLAGADMPSTWGQSPFGYPSNVYTAVDVALAADGTFTVPAALNANIALGNTAYFAAGANQPSYGALTLASIAGDRLSGALSGAPGFAATVRISFIDEASDWYFGKALMQKAMRDSGRMKSCRAGPSQGLGGMFYGGMGWGDYDMMVPAYSLSGMTDAGSPTTEGSFIWLLYEMERLGFNLFIYGHNPDQSLPLASGANFYGPEFARAMTDHAFPMARAGRIDICTPAEAWELDNPGGSRFNFPLAA